MEINCSNIYEVIRAIRGLNFNHLTERYFLAGPCGIGKTTLGKLLSKELQLHFIDHDEMKGKLNVYPNPCSVSKLNIVECLRQSLLIEGNPMGFIFSVGGDSIFRPGVNNDERLMHLRRAKSEYCFVIIVLTAAVKILEYRYLQVENRDRETFVDIWNHWINVEKPYWEKCADCFIETSELEI